MADDITLRRRLSPAATPLNIALRGLSSANRTTGVSAQVYWRDVNDPTTEWQLLGETIAGTTLQVPFDLKGRTIELSAIAKDSKGNFSANLINDGVRKIFAIGPPALSALSFSAPNVTGTIANNGGTGNINVLRKLSTDTEFSAVQSIVPSSTTFTDAPAINGDYQYKLTQDGIDGESGVLIVTVSGGGGGSGTPPGTLTAVFDGTDTVALGWTNHGGSGNNVIEIKYGAGDWFNLDTVSSATNSYSDTENKTSTVQVIYYRVYNDAVTGYSNEAHVTIPREF